MYMQEIAWPPQEGTKPWPGCGGPLKIDTPVAWRVRLSNLRALAHVPQIRKSRDAVKASGEEGGA